MNIFIIGNGFDVANGLPTGYPKFLRMCELTMDSEIKFNYCPLLAEEDKNITTEQRTFHLLTHQL